MFCFKRKKRAHFNIIQYLTLLRKIMFQLSALAVKGALNSRPTLLLPVFRGWGQEHLVDQSSSFAAPKGPFGPNSLTKLALMMKIAIICSEKFFFLFY